MKGLELWKSTLRVRALAAAEAALPRGRDFTDVSLRRCLRPPCHPQHLSKRVCKKFKFLFLYESSRPQQVPNLRGLICTF